MHVSVNVCACIWCHTAVAAVSKAKAGSTRFNCECVRVLFRYCRRCCWLLFVYMFCVVPGWCCCCGYIRSHLQQIGFWRRAVNYCYMHCTVHNNTHTPHIVAVVVLVYFEDRFAAAHLELSNNIWIDMRMQPHEFFMYSSIINANHKSAHNSCVRFIRWNEWFSIQFGIRKHCWFPNGPLLPSASGGNSDPILRN